MVGILLEGNFGVALGLGVVDKEALVLGSDGMTHVNKHYISQKPASMY